MFRCKIFILLFICILFNSCSDKELSNIIIEGTIKNIPTSIVYLADIYKDDILIDSADYKNDTFSFHINPKGFHPSIVSIYFIDNDGRKIFLAYQNTFLSNNNIKYDETIFVLDRGTTTILGSYAKQSPLKIIGSKQNIPLFKTQLIGFGWINTKDKVSREQLINYYKELIKQYPYSYYFISSLYRYRFQYSKEELKSMLSLFDEDTVIMYSKKGFYKYFEQLPKPGMPLYNYAFSDSSGRYQNIFNLSSKLNIVIFWASWCSPCRNEIPELKEIYGKYRHSGIHMVSISMDSNREDWLLALRQENMGWEQLIVGSPLINQVKNYFNFTDIPLIICADSNRMEIIRIGGFNQNNSNRLQNITERFLQKK